MLSDSKIKQLELQANTIRQSIIRALVEAESGHTAGPLGMADIFAYLYFHGLKHDPKDPTWSERDRLVLSNGHICPVLYAAMAHSGYFGDDGVGPVVDFGITPTGVGAGKADAKIHYGVEQFEKTLRKFGSKFQGHPHRDFMPALETSSGPLGSGLSQSVGMAIAERMDRGVSSGKFIYCLMSDGELDEGNTWEAVMLAGKERLGNLIAIIDRNNIQIDGFTEDIMPLEPLHEKFAAWNWHVQEIGGHDFRQIDEAIGGAKAEFGKPSVIIAHTIPGKAVAEFEKKFEWHGMVPNREEGEMALKELRTLGGKIRSEHQ